MSQCSACQHKHRAAIEVDLRMDGPVNWSALRQKYGVHHLALMRHQREHMKPAAYRQSVADETTPAVNPVVTRDAPLSSPAAYDEISISRVSLVIDDEPFLPRIEETPMDALRLGLPHIQRALRLADGDRSQQERLISELNEAVMSIARGED